MSIIKVQRKRGHVWAYVFRHKGKVHKKEGFKVRYQAAEAEAILKAKLRGETYKPKALSIRELTDQYLTDCKTIKGLANNTIRQKGLVLNSLIIFHQCDRMPADELTKDQVKAYLRARARLSGNCAANRDKKEIKALFNWADREEIIDQRNPCRGIGDFPEDRDGRYLPTRQDIMKVKMAADPDERDFLDLVHYLLGRRKEIRLLRWQDINFETRWLDLYTRKKGGGLKRMPKPMSDEVVQILTRRNERKADAVYVFSYTVKDLAKVMPRLCRAAEVPSFGFHALRHYAASSLLSSGHSIKEIQFLLGHERASTTEGYLHVQSGDFHRIVNSME